MTTLRRIPLPLMTPVKEQLEKMEKADIISRVEGPTDWCAGIVVVLKPNNQVRICVDLTQLNKSVKRERHILPSVDHTLAQLSNAKLFNKINANTGFWQVELSKQPSLLTMYITPFGRFWFNRLPFGISSARVISTTYECYTRRPGRGYLFNGQHFSTRSKSTRA